ARLAAECIPVMVVWSFNPANDFTRKRNILSFLRSIIVATLQDYRAMCISHRHGVRPTGVILKPKEKTIQAGARRRLPLKPCQLLIDQRISGRSQSNLLFL